MPESFDHHFLVWSWRYIVYSSSYKSKDSKYSALRLRKIFIFKQNFPCKNIWKYWHKTHLTFSRPTSVTVCSCLRVPTRKLPPVPPSSLCCVESKTATLLEAVANFPVKCHLEGKFFFCQLFESAAVWEIEKEKNVPTFLYISRE